MIHETLIAFNVQCKAASSPNDEPSNEPYKLRIGGHDKRRMTFKGWVVVEKFSYRDRGVEGSYVVMKRDEVSSSRLLLISKLNAFCGQGNPISWRQLWKALIESEVVSPHVLRK
jgi:serine/threonine-protein kinase Chk1